MSDLVDLPVSPEAKEVAEAELAKLAPTPDTSSSSSGEATTAPPPEESTTMTDVSLSPSPTPVAASLAPTPSPSMVSPSAAPVALPIAAVPPTPVLSPSASGATGAAAAPGVEPLCLSSGWLLRRNAGLLGNKTQKVFGRLTLGLSPTVPSMMTCYETDQPGSVKVCSVAIDGSMTVLAESSLLQWTLKTRGGVPSTLAISAASMQSLTGVKWVFGCPTRAEFDAWVEAFPQVQLQAKHWEAQLKAEKERQAAQLAAAQAAANAIKEQHKKQQAQQAAAKAAAEAQLKQQLAAKKLASPGLDSKNHPIAAPVGASPAKSPQPSAGATEKAEKSTPLLSAQEATSSVEPSPALLPAPVPMGALPALSTLDGAAATSADSGPSIAFNYDLVQPIPAVSPTSSPVLTSATGGMSLPFPSPLAARSPSPSGGSRKASDVSDGGEDPQQHGDQVLEGDEAEAAEADSMEAPTGDGGLDAGSRKSSKASGQTTPQRKSSAPESAAAAAAAGGSGEAKLLPQTASPDTIGAVPMVTLSSSPSIVPSIRLPTSPPESDGGVGGPSVAPTPPMAHASSSSVDDLLLSPSSLALSRRRQSMDLTGEGSSRNDFTGIGSDSLTEEGDILLPSSGLPPNSPAHGSAAGSTTGMRSSASTDALSLTSPLHAERVAAEKAAAEAARKKALQAARAQEKKLIDAKAMRQMKNRMYQKLFNLPAHEHLIEDYSAAIRKAILLHGRMYISWNYICFFSSIFSHKTSLVLQVCDVLCATAASVALLFDNSIRIYVQVGPLPIPKINAQGQIVPLPGAPLVVPPTQATTQPQQPQQAPPAGKETNHGSANAQPGDTSRKEGKEEKGATKPSSHSSSPPPLQHAATTANLLTLAANDAPTATMALEKSAEKKPPAEPTVKEAPSDHAPAATTTPSDSATSAGSAGLSSAEASPALGPMDSLDGVTELRSTAELLAASEAATAASLSPSPNVGLVSPSPSPSPPSVPVVLPDLTSESYTGELATTMNASMELNAQQINYLIAIGHANIQQHFFASFLMRDHCLSLIEGLLRKRREANPAWVAMQQAWKQAEETRLAAQAAAAAAAAAVAAAAPKRVEGSSPAPLVTVGSGGKKETRDGEEGSSGGGGGMRELTLASSHSQPASPHSGASTSSHPRHHPNEPYSPLSPSFLHSHSAESTSMIRTDSSGRSLVDSESRMGPSSNEGAGGVQEPPHPRRHTSGSTDRRRSIDGLNAALNVGVGPPPPPASSASLLALLPPYQHTPRLPFGDLAPPADDFASTGEWEDLVDTVVYGATGARGFFECFLGDRAPWTTKEYALASGKGDTDWKLSSWHLPPPASTPIGQLPVDQVPVHGPWVRDGSYMKDMAGTPLGPPVTRVHQTCTFTATRQSVRLEQRNLTPDVTFGDCLYVLERMVLEDHANPSSGEIGVRIRISVGIRFTRQPWRMKMFVGLIRSRTKEDVGAWYTNWIASCKEFMRKEPQKVQAALTLHAMPAASDASMASSTSSSAADGAGGTPLAAAGSPDGAALANVIAMYQPELELLEANSSSAAAAAAAASAGAVGVAPASSASSLPSFSPLPQAPAVPLQDWPWLRSSLTSIPGAPVDAICSGVLQAREATRHGSAPEKIFAALLLLAGLSAVLHADLSWLDLLLTLVLPWRWFGLLSVGTEGLLTAALVCLLWNQRTLQAQLQQLTALTQQQALVAQRTHQQVEDLRTMVAAHHQQNNNSSAASASAHMSRKSGNTIRVDEQHFR